MGRPRPRRRAPALGAVPAERSRHRGVGLTAPSWVVRRRTGDPVDLLGRPLPDDRRRRVEILVPSRPAVVLGSTQADAVVDGARARAAGVAVVRRRSGGGAVWLDDDVVWVDVWIPSGDRLWDDDVGRAFHWLGQAWAAGLANLGVDATWHDGPLVRTEWSDLVCFAGVGPGEVLGPSGVKVVGMAQRRTRSGALFQCAALRRWDPRPLVDVLEMDSERRRTEAVEALAGAGMAVAAAPEVVEEALIKALPA